VQDLEKLLPEKGNIKLGVRETGWKVMDQVHMAQNMHLVVKLFESAPASPEDTTLPFPLS
jgi:hypothetical protein